MSLEHYRSLFNEVKRSYFLYLQSSALFITTYIDWTLIPFVTKFEGLYLPVFMISLFMLVGALDGIIQPLFKHIKIYNIYMFAIILDIVQIFSYSLISYSMIVFTYVILSIFTIQGITFEIARIHTVDFMQDEKIELKDYLILRSFVISSAIIAGSFSSIIFDFFKIDFSFVLIFISILGSFGIIIQIKLYKKFKKKVYSDHLYLEKDKKELYEKFRD